MMKARAELCRNRPIARNQPDHLEPAGTRLSDLEHELEPCAVDLKRHDVFARRALPENRVHSVRIDGRPIDPGRDGEVTPELQRGVARHGDELAFRVERHGLSAVRSLPTRGGGGPCRDQARAR